MRDGWEVIDNIEIHRYKAHKDGLDLLIKSLGGLRTTMSQHIDFKSRCMKVLITEFLTAVAPWIQRLPPVSDFYKEENSVVSVNWTVFNQQRITCTEVLTKLRQAIKDAHDYLQLWHTQEFGNIHLIEDHPTHGPTDWSPTFIYLENMIWDHYIEGHTALFKDI
jgi:hypothetical protein